MTNTKGIHNLIIGLEFLLILAIFTADMLTPLGIAWGFVYIIPLLLTLWIPGKINTISIACIGVILTVFKFYYSSWFAALLAIVITNRLLSIMGILVTMSGILLLKKELRITEQSKQELEKLARGLKISNIELEQFAFIASHDLQQPLNNISNYVGLLRKKLKATLDAESTDFMNVIVHSAEKMKILITELLFFSRIGKNRTIEKVDANRLLNEVVLEMNGIIRQNHASIIADLLPVINYNNIEFKQILHNLISNAIKFKKQNVSPEIHIHCINKGKEWEFSVSDNGIGIKENDFKKLFFIFQRLHSEEEYPGIGSGLATCKKIIETNGGKIWLSSKPDQGSTFYFTIPKP